MLKAIRKRPIATAAITLVLGLVGAVATVPAARLAVVNAPSLWFAGEIQHDLVYDPATGQRLDLYIPASAPGGQAGPEGRPVVLFLHGGRWQEGDKDDYRFIGTALAARGFITAVADYRKYPAVRFPAFVEDSAAAVAWLKGHVATHGGDPDRLFVAGHSAGAHIGALLVSDRRYLAAHGMAPTTVRGFAGLAGPYHFTPEAPDLVDLFGPPARFPDMQASHFVDGDEPAMLLAYGLDDDTVYPVNHERLSAALAARDRCHQVVLYPGVDHIDIVSDFTWVFRARHGVMDDVVGFFQSLADGTACPR